MSEIKFTINNMVQIHNSLSELIEQLFVSVTNSNESLDNISENIQNENFHKILKNYTTITQECFFRLKSHLKDLDKYLVEKIENYRTINVDSTDSLTEIEQQLNQHN